MTVPQHKVIILIPSARRLELERLIEELMEGVEGYKHLGTYEFDPTKPQFFARKVSPKAKANGAGEAQSSQYEEAAVTILAILNKERRPFTRHELCKRTGREPWVVTKGLAILMKGHKIHQIIRGIYEANPN
jgi:hypothetical protein